MTHAPQDASPQDASRPRRVPAARLRGLLDAAQRRFRRTRPGSVLILVVALLVLLALIGTAFITSAGNDRDSSVQHQYNTQIELLLSALKELAAANIVDKVAAVDPPMNTAILADPTKKGTQTQTTPIPSYRPPLPAALDPTDPPLTPNTAFARTDHGFPYPAFPFPPPPQYSNYVDYAPYDHYLADRIPAPGQPNPPNPSPFGVWSYISGNPLGKIEDRDRLDPGYPGDRKQPALLTNQFTSPLVDANRDFVPHVSTRFGLKPDHVQLKDANGVVRIYPALQVLDPFLPGHPAPEEKNTYEKFILAADADGDGIADAGLFELPIGQVNGVRYYGAMRVIDHNSAINANTAWENFQPRFPEDARLPGNFTPANVDFRALVEGYTVQGSNALVTNIGPHRDNDNDPLSFNAPFNTFNRWRFGDVGLYGANRESPFLHIIRENILLKGGRIDPPVDAQSATRYDALWTGLGSRPGNPGYNHGDVTTLPNARYRSLGLSDTVALAKNGGVTTPNASQTKLDEFFPVAYRGAAVAPQTPYTPNKWKDWFNNIYDYDYLDNRPAPVNTPLRALTTTYNPVTNYVPGYLNRAGLSEFERAGQFRYRGAHTPGAAYAPGDWVQAAGTVPGTNQAWVCCAYTNPIETAFTVQLIPNTGSPDGLQVWAPAPWERHPTKINPNTASFPLLAATYHAVMADGPPDVAPLTNGTEPRPFSKLPPGNPDPAYKGTDAGTDTNWWQPGVFMDVTRDLAGAPKMNSSEPHKSVRRPLTPPQMKQLRAAIAAVNTIDIRDADDDVTSRSVYLVDPNDPPGTIPLRADVYGTERQPFITEASVNINELDRPWVCIELYNPYPVPINLTGYRLAYRTRDATEANPAGGNKEPIRPGQPRIVRIDGPDPSEALSTLGTIPPGGYAFVENDKGARPMSIQNDPAYMSRLDAKMLLAPKLGDVIGGGGTRELLLLRTRRSDGTPSFSTNPIIDTQLNPANRFREDEYVDGPVSLLVDFVPVDQLQFEGMTVGTNFVEVQLTDAAGPKVTVKVEDRWHYRRANTDGPGGFVNRWHCVYAGPYAYRAGSPVDGSPSRRQRGWIRDRRPIPSDPMKPEVLDRKQSAQPGFGAVKGRMVANSAAFTEHNVSKGSPAIASNEATFRTRSLQLNAAGFGGPWKPLTGENAAGYTEPQDPDDLHAKMPAPDNRAVPAFPFGGFARLGDLLQVTFVGGYKIEHADPANAFPSTWEINPVTMDAALADDGDVTDDDTAGGTGGGNPVEQLGRFCPIRDPSQPLIPLVQPGQPSPADPAGGFSDFEVRDRERRPNPDPTVNPMHRYAWAKDLFDYFAVLSPQDDYQPDADTSNYLDPAKKAFVSGDPTVRGSYPKWPQQPTNWPAQAADQETDPADNRPRFGLPHATANGPRVRSSAVANHGVEEGTGVHGLINLNTAPAKVIATLPFTDNRVTNLQIAKSIVYYREKIGPIRSLWDLQHMPIGYNLPYNGGGAPTAPAFMNALGDVNTLDPTILQGDVTPNPANSAAADGVGGDFEARYLMLTRISNLVTFRSDTFTVYLTVQGWRNAGTANPELVVQRRAAFIVDRTTVRPDLAASAGGGGAIKVTNPLIFNVPQE